MNRLSKLGMLILAGTLTNCASSVSNMHIGNDMYYVSLSEQRAASQTVSELESIPPEAQVIRNISASRCHRSFIETAPTEETVTLDLKLMAYALGADAIADIRIEQNGGLARNCWHMLNGEAIALTLPSSQNTNASSAATQESSSNDSLTDQQIRQILIQQSIAAYSGSCACPYNRASNGSRCGGRSAYSRPGGESPLCYDRDVSQEMISRYRARN